MNKKLLSLCLLLLISMSSFGNNFEKGARAFNFGDYRTAYDIWYPMALNGDSNAQHNIGRMFYEGLGVRQNYSEGLRWFDRSAKQGNPRSLNSLGVAYYDGRAISIDWVAAYTYFLLAEEFGDNEAAPRNISRLLPNLNPKEMLEAALLARDWKHEFGVYP